MRVVAVIQARHGSSRLPGKVLLPLGAGCVLDEVIRRCRSIAGVAATCVAVPDGADSNSVAARAESLDATVVRGPESDVLARYGLAAARTEADVVLRVTSDCPLLDPEAAAQVIAAYEREAADYAANNRPPRSWPHGLDCEAIGRRALETALASATAPYDREHVTPWLRRSEEVRRAWVGGPGGRAADWRWTLDFPEDYAFLSAVFDRLEGGTIPSWTAVASLIEHDPLLLSLHARARARAETSG